MKVVSLLKPASQWHVTALARAEHVCAAIGLHPAVLLPAGVQLKPQSHSDDSQPLSHPASLVWSPKRLAGFACVRRAAC